MTESVRALWYMFFPGGGIGRYTHEVAEQLHRMTGVDVELACLPEYQFLKDANYRTWPHLWRIHSDRPVLRRARFLCGQVVSPWRAIQHARKSGAQVLHLSNINHLTFPLWRRWLVRSPSIRLVATAHDVRRSKKIIHSGWETRALKQFYEAADALFIHSTHQKDELLNFANVREEKVVQVPMGTMPYAAPSASRKELRERLGIPQSRLVGLFFGNIRDDKNLDGLLTAMSLRKASFFLIIAGRAGGSDNRNTAFYQQRIEELGLTADVLFLDRFIENDEVGDLFEASDFVPLCYRTSFTSQSAVLNVAMHYRRPVLVSPAPTLAETARVYRIGVMTDSDAPESLAAGIDDLLKMIDTGTDFEFDAYQQSNSWSENARITAEVYHRLMHSGLRIADTAPSRF